MVIWVVKLPNTLYRTDAWCRFNNEASNGVCISNMNKENINRCDTNKQSAAKLSLQNKLTSTDKFVSGRCWLLVIKHVNNQYFKLGYICSLYKNIKYTFEVIPFSATLFDFYLTTFSYFVESEPIRLGCGRDTEWHHRTETTERDTEAHF